MFTAGRTCCWGLCLCSEDGRGDTSWAVWLGRPVGWPLHSGPLGGLLDLAELLAVVW